MAAFELMSEEVDSAIGDLTGEIKLASDQKNFEQVEKLSRLCKSLVAFQKKVEQLKKEWLRDFDQALRQRARQNHAQGKPSKAPHRRLSITFPDGTCFDGPEAAESFVRAIEKIGADKVKELGLQVCKVPLVATEKDKKYGSSQRARGGYYVMTHCSTKDKKTLLEAIAHQLKLGLQVALLDK